MNNFGDFLYALRKEKGITQAQLAQELGVTNKAVSKWETGEAMPETSLLVPLSKIFGVTVDELLNGERQREHNSIGGESAEFPSPDYIKNHMFTRGKEESATLGDKICGALCGLIVTLGFISYLLVGVFTSLWHPYWIISAVCPLICGIIGCIFDMCNPLKREKKRAKGENPYTGNACGIIILSSVIAYLFVGVFTSLWHPYWVIVAAGGVACFAIGCVGDVIKHGKNKK